MYSMAKQFHLSELSIIRNVHSSDSSKIFLVKYEGAKYCLKVFHVNNVPGFTSTGRDLCRYRCEIEAYKLLSAAEICEQGFVPKFHAIQKAIQGITAVHHAGVVHNDPYPKNVLIVPGAATNGSDDRVVWIDFDIALNFGSEKVKIYKKA
ncbi:conserved hypothetical protein [Coccidioides posadasii str. Silveira]|uniref:Protein kinase domain-containing protein n=1 Tax=Coccidioides posadasii (strain RMSCC 757 / Silveira) TaxID=443226 RepID=E9D6R0_COCPS|nr:conserved hypothetical protein [Coccidioides posadasii str. Silveira]